MIAAAVLNEWYSVAMASQIHAGQRRETLLLGQPITVALSNGVVVVQGVNGPLHVCEHYGHIWAGPGTPARISLRSPRPPKMAAVWSMSALCG